jgi:hypothetical protein
MELKASCCQAELICLWEVDQILPEAAYLTGDLRSSCIAVSVDILIIPGYMKLVPVFVEIL